MNIYLVRHGRSLSNMANTYSDGSTELDPQYLDELKPAKAYLNKIHFDGVFTSDYTRCIQTAEALGYPDAVREPRLRERSFGVFEGLTPTQVWDKYQADYAALCANPVTYAAPEGETYEEVCRRVWSFLDELSAKERASFVATPYGMRPDPAFNENYLLVCHYNVLSSALGWVMGTTQSLKGLAPQNGAILQVQVYGPVKSVRLPRMEFLAEE